MDSSLYYIMIRRLIFYYFIKTDPFIDLYLYFPYKIVRIV